MTASTAKALRVHGFDGLHQWRIEDAPLPEPGPGEVRVRVAATAISFVDLLFARGGYQIRPALPLTPGTEFSGVISACGPGVAARLRPGVPVCGTAFGGAWAEVVRASAGAVQALPAGLDLPAASVLPITYVTALYALRERGHLQPGETVLVLGAAGGVGMACIQVAKALGAHVIAGASSEAKRQACRQAGADAAVDTARADWRDAVQASAPGGIDVVADPVGGQLTETAFRTLRWGGRCLVLGFAEGAIPSVRTNLPLLKGAAMVGVDVRQFREREPERAQTCLADVVTLFASGALRPRIAQVFPATEWAHAIAAAADRSGVGRVVMDWGRAD